MTRYRPDLDNPEAIHRLVRLFYSQLLDDPTMRPVFVEVAGIDLTEHLPRIEAYWCKMLLGQTGYSRNMVRQHEQVDDLMKLDERHFQLWQQYFEQTLDTHFSGPYTEKARRVARKVLRNLASWLAQRNCQSSGNA